MAHGKTQSRPQEANVISLTENCEIAYGTKKFGVRKESLALMLIIALLVSACDKVPIGPVDHECHVNPTRSHGAGCEDYH